MPAQFIKPLSKLGFIDGINWLVESQVQYFSEVLGSVVTIEKHTVTDFASIPRILWNIYPPAQFAQAAVVHDELYTKQTCTRKEADAVFLEALILTGVPKHRATIFYLALRVAGFVAWNEHAKQNRILAAVRAAQDESAFLKKEDL